MSDSPATLKHILVVEDDEAYARLVRRMLEAEGYRVTIAKDFVTALPIIEGSDEVDLLLADINLPPGTPHGLSIGLMAEARRRDLKTVYMSGSIDTGAISRFAPHAKVLRKPFTAAELSAAIKAALPAI
ncbi:MAG TPA: response regulator [Stellaceae bacterium]|nr:response regulator [Stellaceae bacterium]